MKMMRLVNAIKHKEVIKFIYNVIQNKFKKFLTCEMKGTSRISVKVSIEQIFLYKIILRK